jgi:hypothetical protein
VNSKSTSLENINTDAYRVARDCKDKVSELFQSVHTKIQRAKSAITLKKDEPDYENLKTQPCVVNENDHVDGLIMHGSEMPFDQYPALNTAKNPVMEMQKQFGIG